MSCVVATHIEALRFTMTSYDLNPGPFYGRKLENAETWFDAIKNWTVYKRLNPESAIAAVALLLREGALMWFNNLEEDTRRSADAFTREFNKRYIAPNNVDKWKKIVAVYNVKQNPEQSVDDYIDFMQNMGRKAKANNEQVLAAIIEGLRPYIHRNVLQHEPKIIQG